ncbi:hypothetical protein ES703_112257 [subsurface metagenome]
MEVKYVTLAEKRISRDAFIYKLSLLGWTQAEIGEAVELDHSTISGIVGEFNQFNLPTIKSDFYEKHKATEALTL